MFNIYHYAANAACPQRPSWNISEVGYAWAQAVANFHRKKSKLFQKKNTPVQMSAQEEAFRFELVKPYENIFGAGKKKAVVLCKNSACHDNSKLTA